MNASLKTVGAACLTAGLVSTWDVPANAQACSFTGEITPTHDLTSVYFLFATGGCVAAYSKKIADFIPGNTTLAFTITMQSIPSNVYSANGFYTVAGLYGDPANGNVALAFNPARAAGILTQDPSMTWDGPFFMPGFHYIGGSEADVASDLQSGTISGVSMDDAGIYGPLSGNFFGVYSPGLTPFPAESTFSLIDFTGASAGGSGFVVEVVPEPATISFLATGANLLTFGWLRRRK